MADTPNRFTREGPITQLQNSPSHSDTVMLRHSGMMTPHSHLSQPPAHLLTRTHTHAHIHSSDLVSSAAAEKATAPESEGQRKALACLGCLVTTFGLRLAFSSMQALVLIRFRTRRRYSATECHVCCLLCVTLLLQEGELTAGVLSVGMPVLLQGCAHNTTCADTCTLPLIG